MLTEHRRTRTFGFDNAFHQRKPIFCSVNLEVDTCNHFPPRGRHCEQNSSPSNGSFSPPPPPKQHSSKQRCYSQGRWKKNNEAGRRRFHVKEAENIVSSDQITERMSCIEDINTSHPLITSRWSHTVSLISITQMRMNFQFLSE